MRPTAAGRGRRGAVLAATVAVGLLAVARPAGADPPRPTDYRSTVTGLTPPVAGVDAEVVGGDAFLELRVDAGTEVTVAGYEGEPYLRFRRDGTVERNARSQATYLNEDRQGDVDVPARADSEARPAWDQVASGGSYAWHDHRIHWMAGTRPPGLEPGDLVQRWAVPITVDGAPAEVRGRLVLAEDVDPLPWFALALVAAVAALVIARRHPVVATSAAATVAAAAALAAGWGQYSVAPAGSGADPLLVAVPLAGLLAGGLALVLRRRTAGPVAGLAAAAAVVGWGLLRVEVLWTPVLPTVLAADLDRALTATALGLAVAAAAGMVWSGAVGVGRQVQDAAPDPDHAAAARGGGGPR